MPDHAGLLKPLAYTRLNDEQAAQIHTASLEILERLGVQVHLPEAAALLRKGGAQVSEEGHVRLPARLVEWALKAAPPQVTLYNRLGEAVMPLSGERCFFGPGSDTLNIIDHRSGERRKPRLSDVAEGARLCDALKHIDFVMSMCLPADVEATIADTCQTEILLNNTVKPILLVAYGVEGLVDAVKMAEAVLGGEEALRQKPMLACYINVVSGAVHNTEGLQKLLYLADKGLPAIYIPGSNAGVTSPATLPGAIALDNAGGLLGLTLAQLRREGTPYIVSAMDPAALDMRTMVSPYAYAERGIIRSLAQRYGLPSFALSGATDAKSVDQQAAAEAALTLMAEVLLGGNLIHDLGYLESGLTFSFTQLVICDQMVDWIKGFYRPVEVSPASLALDVIEQVGPGGQYLKHRHTRQHYREHWYPDLFERGVYSDWQNRGAQSLGERAAARVEQLLQTHTLAPLPAETQARLREIVRRAERRAPPGQVGS
jgi:trimethylamine--corrinoid protein Co-methyltransferase